MLDASTDLTVLGAVLLSALQQRPSGPFAVRDDQSGADVDAIAEHGYALAVLGQAGVPPGFRVRRVAGHGAGGRHHPGAWHLHDLHVHREPIGAGGGTYLAVPDPDEGAVDDPQPFACFLKGSDRLEGEQRKEHTQGWRPDRSGKPWARGNRRR